jgi:hypothetical protein
MKHKKLRSPDGTSGEGPATEGAYKDFDPYLATIFRRKDLTKHEMILAGGSDSSPDSSLDLNLRTINDKNYSNKRKLILTHLDRGQRKP